MGLQVYNGTGMTQVVGPELRHGEWADLPSELAERLKGEPGFRVEDPKVQRFKDGNTLYLGWSSPFHYADGYGSIAQEIAAELIRMGVKLSIWPRDYDPGHKNFGKFCLDEWEHKAFVPREVVQRLKEEQDDVLYGINMTWPREIHQRPFPRCIGLTMFETTRPPREWAESMNRVRRIIVPCKQNKDAFEGIGVRTPIEVIPLGVNPEKWPFVDRADMRYRTDKPFVFLMAAGLTYRKNPDGAAKAFLAAFPRESDVKLILKTRGAESSLGFWKWSESTPQDPRIQIVREESSPEQMVGWMAEADAFLFPSRAEGFGLTPLQAMSTGLPTIISDNSGMSEYANAVYNYPVHCHEVPVPKAPDPAGYPMSWGDVGNWWEPSFDGLVSALREVYTYREAALHRGREAARWVRDNWTVRRTCEGILNLVIKDAGALG